MARKRRREFKVSTYKPKEIKYSVGLLARLPQFSRYIDIITAIYPNPDTKITVDELRVKLMERNIRS